MNMRMCVQTAAQMQAIDNREAVPITVGHTKWSSSVRISMNGWELS